MGTLSDSGRFRLMYELGQAFATRIELDELIPFVIATCREVFDAQGASVLLLDPTTNELYFPYASSDDPEVAARLARLRIPIDRGIAGRVLKSRRVEKVDAVQSDPRFYGDADRVTGISTRSLIAAPLTSGDVALGVIEVINRRGGGIFSDDDTALLETLAHSIAVAIANARRFSEVKTSAELLRAQVGALRRDLPRRERFAEIIGTSRAMSEVFKLVDSAAASSLTVLIEGETGTGKELVARAIHRTGSRADGAFIAINCAAFAETLLESELFGHRRGAFTGATRDEPGLLRAASGGTLFLDEVGEMPASMQAKLLRVLEQGEVIAVGDTRPHKVDVRVVCATNRDLKAAVAERTFREDLFYRIAVFPIRLPPLRERREDIPLLAAQFLSSAAKNDNKRITGFDASSLDILERCNWPGNVRQLHNEIARAVALAKDGDAITPAHLSSALAAASETPAISPPASDATPRPFKPMAPHATPLREARAAFEADHIARALAEHNRNVSRTAAALGISRVALQKKMKEYSLR